MTDKEHTIAHELRNLLGLIALEVHAAAASASDPAATRRSLAEISSVLARCVDVVASLETSSSPPASEVGRDVTKDHR
jgi:hypothetical protein